MLLGTLISLLVQFMLGMAVNLFVKIPEDHPGARPSEFFAGAVSSVTWALLQGPVLLILHASLGLLLAVSAVVILVRGFSWGTLGVRVTCILGAVGVLAAGLNGGSFLNYDQDVNSLLMSAGFALAVLSYLVAIYLLPVPGTIAVNTLAERGRAGG
jgi:hypothetical protein